jgi:hypothetical protein
MVMTTDTDLPELQDADDFPVHDVLLSVLVRTTDAMPGSEIGITLYVAGTIVTGQIIAVSDYYAELGADVAGAAGSAETADSRSAVADGFTELAAEMRPDSGAPLADQPPPAFIHLRGARVVSHSGALTLPPTLWRGRLDHVSGWSLGTLTEG